MIVQKGFSNLHMLIKQKSPLLPRNLTLRTLSELLKVFSAKVNLLNSLLYSQPRSVLFPRNYSLKTFLGTLILMNRVSLYLFYLAERIWNCIIFMLTPKIFKKLITNLDSSKASSPDCIPILVLNNCEPDLSYILAELFIKCLKESRQILYCSHLF